MKEPLFVFLGLWLLVAGCLKPLPPEPIPPVLVDVRQVTPIHTITVMPEEDASPPIKTWLSKEEVDAQRLQEAIDKAAQEDPCQKGDPLCEHIQSTP